MINLGNRRNALQFMLTRAVPLEPWEGHADVVLSSPSSALMEVLGPHHANHGEVLVCIWPYECKAHGSSWASRRGSNAPQRG
jgi:hypothetical protein